MTSPVLLVIFFIFGLLIGSFLNALIWRWPRGQGLSGRSACPHCRHKLAGMDLVPLASFIFLGGRCRYCRAPISRRYPFIELATGLLFALIALKFSPHDLITWLYVLRGLFIVSVLIAVFVIDLEHYLILDRLIIPAAIIILMLNIIVDAINRVPWHNIHSFTAGGVIAALIIAIFFLLQWLISSSRWIGLGDVKLGLFMGLALGWPNGLVGLFAAYALGVAAALPLLAFGKKRMGSQIPFGTFLSAGTLVALLWGGSIASWYLRLINWQ